MSAMLMLLTVLTVLGAGGAFTSASAESITINAAAKISNYSQVSLAIVPPASAVELEMAIQNESILPTVWEKVVNPKLWDLSSGVGTKSVSVKFRDKVTKINVGTKVSDTIILDPLIDTGFNAGSTTYPGTANFHNGTAVHSPATAANAVAVYPATNVTHAGKTVTVGTYDNGNGDTDIQVIRYNLDGTKDFQFTYEHVGADFGNAVAIDPDGKIVVAGTLYRGPSVTDIFALRLTDLGALDPNFGINGILNYISKDVDGNLLNDADSGNGVAIQADKRIVIVGSHLVASNSSSFAKVLRFDANGTIADLDLLFDANVANAVTIDTTVPGNDKIVVVGTYDMGDGENSSLWVVRLNSNGTVDVPFSNLPSSPGHLLFGDNGLHSGNAVAIDPVSHKIVLVGTYGGTQAWVLQLLNDGNLDIGFNHVGSVTFDGPVAAKGNAVAIDSNGKIVVAGLSDLGGGASSFLVMRLNNSGALEDTLTDTTFNNGSYDYTFGIGGPFAARAVALQPDGKIVVAGVGEATRLGYSALPGSTSMLTMRLFDKTYSLAITSNVSGTVAVYPETLLNGTRKYLPGTTVTLMATPVTGASFINWIGCTAVPGTPNVCTVTMDQSRSVTAVFSAPLNLTITVSGNGVVAGDLGSINCFSGVTPVPVCSAGLPLGAVVTLTAAVPWNASLVWGGACSTAVGNSCSVTMSQARNVTAAFISNKNVRLNNSSLYSTLFDAYSGVTPGATSATIDAQIFTFLENLQLGTTGLIVSLNGGLDTNFANAGSNFTKVKGLLKINAGRLNARNIKVQ
jgi:uncharacterized delta-60 repeat protein